MKRTTSSRFNPYRAVRSFFGEYKLICPGINFTFDTLQELRDFEESVLEPGSIVEYDIRPKGSLKEKLVKYLTFS